MKFSTSCIVTLIAYSSGLFVSAIPIPEPAYNLDNIVNTFPPHGDADFADVSLSERDNKNLEAAANKYNTEQSEKPSFISAELTQGHFKRESVASLCSDARNTAELAICKFSLSLSDDDDENTADAFEVDSAAAAIDTNAIPKQKVRSSEKQQQDKMFNIRSYREGVPYLHNRLVMLTDQNELVVNGDSDDTLFVGFMSDSKTIVSAAHAETVVNSTVDVYPDGALRLGSGSFLTTGGGDPNKNKPSIVDNSGVSLAGATTVGWAVQKGTTEETKNINFLKLSDAKVNTWSCPEGKSGVYHMFTSLDRPKGRYGCISVDLYIPDKLTTSKDSDL